MATSIEMMTGTVTRIAASSTATSTLRVAPQGGILEGGNPTHWDAKNPIILFIIQAGIIISLCRLLHYPLSRLRQPRVIAEVIGGILLGPSVMGRIPGFTDAIFPTTSIPSLNLVANLGLVLFLFLVGLEVDLRYFVSNWRPAVSVGAAGMAIPFGLGCAIAWGLYHEFHDEPGTVPIAFGTYMLFIGVAMAITAFPVLCRILTELDLLNTPVGVIVLSAGVANDVIGWILLALCVALVNAGSGITALWVLLTCIGYAIFLAFVVRPAFVALLKRNRSIETGPSQGMVTLTLMLALTSAFFTGIIGVHPIFGAFMAGLICPHEGAFRVKVVEKIEDLVSAIFLPLYFALSGLSTNLGLLDSGITWAYVIGVIAIAFCGKFAGGTLAARLNGRVWRESCTIGVLMSCKGLVELIVLNIGLQARILSPTTFTIFVVMALVTTFATTPLTAWLYPPAYQRKLESWKRGEIDWATGAPTQPGAVASDVVNVEKLESIKINTLLLYLRLDTMPALLSIVSLFGGKPDSGTDRKHPQYAGSDSLPAETDLIKPRPRPVTVHGVRLLELTDRSSSVMMVSEAEELSSTDPVINAFRVLGQLYSLLVSGEVNIIPEETHARTLVEISSDEAADLLLVPWSESGSLSEASPTSDPIQAYERIASESYNQFIQKTLDHAQCHVAVFVSQTSDRNGRGPPSGLQRSMSSMSIRNRRHNAVHTVTDRGRHIFMPYFGGADDRVALRLVLQLAESPNVTATIVQFELPKEQFERTESSPIGAKGTPSLNNSSSDSPHSLQRETGLADASTFFAMMQRSLPASLDKRVVFETVMTSNLLDEVASRSRAEVGQSPLRTGDLVILGINANRIGHDGASSSTHGSCLGSVASRLLDANSRASLIAVQSSIKDAIAEAGI